MLIGGKMFSRAILTLIVFLVFVADSIGANISVLPSNTLVKSQYSSRHIEISGKIESGDYEKLVQVFKEYKDGCRIGQSYQLQPLIRLDSQGGNLGEAFKMGEFLRKIEANTSVATDGECASSCVFLLASGVIRDVWMGGKLGLHRPRFDFEPYGGLSREMAETEYRNLIDAAESYLKRMGIHDQVISDMLSTPSRSIKYVGREYAEKYGLLGKDAAWEEWQYAQSVELHGENEMQLLGELKDCTIGISIHSEKYKACIKQYNYLVELVNCRVLTPLHKEECEKKYIDEYGTLPQK